MLLLADTQPTGRTANITLIDLSTKMPKKKPKNMIGSVTSQAEVLTSTMKERFKSPKSIVGFFNPKEKNKEKEKEKEKEIESNKRESMSQSKSKSSPLAPSNSNAPSVSQVNSDLRELFAQKTGGRDVNNKVTVNHNPFEALANSLNLRGEKIVMLSQKTTALQDSAKLMFETSQSANKS